MSSRVRILYYSGVTAFVGNSAVEVLLDLYNQAARHETTIGRDPMTGEPIMVPTKLRDLPKNVPKHVLALAAWSAIPARWKREALLYISRECRNAGWRPSRANPVNWGLPQYNKKTKKKIIFKKYKIHDCTAASTASINQIPPFSAPGTYSTPSNRPKQHPKIGIWS